MSVVLTGVVLGLYFVMTGDVIPSWPVILLLAMTVCQAAFSLLKDSATSVEARHGTK